MPIGTIIGISMIVAGVILSGLVIWQAMRYRQHKRDQENRFDD